MLRARVGDARRELELDQPPPVATLPDARAFAAWVAIVVMGHVLVPIGLLATTALAFVAP